MKNKINKISKDEFAQSDKGVLKKSGKGLKIALATTLSAIVLFWGGTAIYANVSLSDYANQKQMVSIAQEIDCDIGYLNENDNKFIRMQHNNGEPIYVCLDVNMTEIERQYAIEGLDYMFGIVGSINDKYKYEIVDLVTYNKVGNKTKMLFQVRDKLEGQDSNDQGYINSQINRLSLLTSKRVANEFEIYQNRSLTKDDLEEIEYTYKHEIMHAFGIDDVYLTDTLKLQGNTYINQAIGKQIGIITPNDYKCLMALYTEKFDNDAEKKQTLDKYQKMIDEYEEYYYDVFTKTMVEDLGLSQTLEDKTINWQGYGHFTTSVDNKQYVYKYGVKIKNNKYDFTISDKENNLVDSFSGNAIYKNGIIVLQDVELQKGLVPLATGNPEGTIQDFILVKENGVVKLINSVDARTISGVMYFSPLATEQSAPELE